MSRGWNNVMFEIWNRNETLFGRRIVDWLALRIFGSEIVEETLREILSRASLQFHSILARWIKGIDWNSPKSKFEVFIDSGSFFNRCCWAWEDRVFVLRILIASQNTENPSLLPEAIVFHNFSKKYVCFKLWKYAKAVNPSQSFSPNAGRTTVRAEVVCQRNALAKNNEMTWHKNQNPCFCRTVQQHKQTIIHSSN